MRTWAKKYRKQIINMGMNLGILICMLLLFYPYYGTKIDLFMKSMASEYNIAGKGMARVFFSNIFLGKALKIWTGLFPQYGYIAYQYILIFIAFLTIGYIVMKQIDSALSKVILFFTFVFCGYECYVVVDYRKTASLLVCAALFVWYDLVEERGKQEKIINKKSIIMGVFAGLLFWVASMICYSISMWILFAGVFGYIIICLIKKEWWKLITKKWIYLVGAIVLAVGVHAIDNHYYTIGNEAIFAKGYRASLEKLYVYGNPVYKSLNSEIQDVISETDYNSFINGADVSENVDMAQLTIDVAKQKLTLNKDTLLSFFRTMPIKAFTVGMFYCWLSLLLMIGLSKMQYKNKLVVFSILYLVVIYLILYVCNAWNATGVSHIVFMILSLFLLCILSEFDELDVRTVGAYMCVLCVILYNKFASQIPSANSNLNNKLIAYVEENSDKQFICDVDYGRVSIEGLPENLLFLSGTANNYQIMNAAVDLILSVHDIRQIWGTDSIYVIEAFDSNDASCPNAVASIFNSMEKYGTAQGFVKDKINEEYAIYEMNFSENEIIDGFERREDILYYYRNGKRVVNEDFVIDGVCYKATDGKLQIVSSNVVDINGAIIDVIPVDEYRLDNGYDEETGALAQNVGMTLYASTLSAVELQLVLPEELEENQMTISDSAGNIILEQELVAGQNEIKIPISSNGWNYWNIVFDSTVDEVAAYMQ